MDIPIIRPKTLRPGDTVAIIAPAGPVEQRDDFQRGVATIERWGFRVRYSDRIFQSFRYLAGRDADRAEELISALEDPDVAAIVALRGGYGCARLLSHLDQRRLRNHCKIFMGFSDLSTLHLLFRRRFGWVTFHGPMATSAALGCIKPEQETHLYKLWTDAGYLPSFSFPELKTEAPGITEGELVGGCLSLVVASLGTPYEIVTEGRILFLEDLGEPPYRIDRMITQLRLAHKLDRISGLLLGSFLDCEDSSGKYTLEDTLRDLLLGLEVPILSHFPAGHGSDNWALPLGIRAELDASNRRLRFLERATDPA